MLADRLQVRGIRFAHIKTLGAVCDTHQENWEDVVSCDWLSTYLSTLRFPAKPHAAKYTD